MKQPRRCRDGHTRIFDYFSGLDAVAGPERGAPYHAPTMQGSYTAAMQQPVGRLRIALVDSTFSGKAINPQVRDAVMQTGTVLEGLGHHVEALVPKVGIDAMMHAWTDIVACGTALWIDRALARSSSASLTDDDVEPVALSARDYARTLSGCDYLAAVEKIHLFGREMEALFGSDSSQSDADIDVILCATLAEPPANIGRFDHSRNDYLDYRLGDDGVFAYSPFTAIFNASGQPCASLPLGWSSDGLPIGIHLACRFGEDEKLMALCAQIESASPWFSKRPPTAMRDS